LLLVASLAVASEPKKDCGHGVATLIKKVLTPEEKPPTLFRRRNRLISLALKEILGPTAPIIVASADPVGDRKPGHSVCPQRRG